MRGSSGRTPRGTRTTRATRTRWLAVSAVLAVVLAAGCTAGDGDEEPATDPSPTTDASPSTPEPLPGDDGDDDGEDDADDGAATDADGTGTDGADGDADGGTDGEATVLVFFGNEERGTVPAVFPVERTVAAPAVLRGALEELLAGPTPAEEAEGYSSFFSDATADQLDDVALADGVAEVSFSSELPELIPNASTSAGSGALLAALDATATQFDTVDEAIYSLEGDVDAFYEWLQLSSPG